MAVYEKIREVLVDEKIDAVLISDAYNMRYISGFTGGTGYLLITKNSLTLFTDSRYTIAATEQAKDFNVVEVDAGRNYPLFINKVFANEKVKSLGIESERMTYANYLSLKSKLDVKELVPLRDEITKLRRIKNKEEIEALRHAEHIGDVAFSEILHHIKPGRTEIEIAAKLEYIMKIYGAEKLSFETIIASGINTSKPHAEPGQRVIQKGDFVTLDFGCVYKGYCSDMTRTVVVGKANDKQRKIYETVKNAQQAVLDMLKPGLPGKEYDKVARDIIYGAGYEGCFGHGLGHSVGLEIHENPRFSQIEEDIILPGMVITVEPGIYVEGFGGVRIEDMVLVTEDGYENFAFSEKELIEL